jgi:MOSC domain-containing protein YiiM
MQILSVQVGKVESFLFNNKEMTTAIHKKPVELPIFLGFQHFSEDEQADLVYHGGADKAVCVYSFEHYAHWESYLEQPLSFGAFGENLTVQGMLEPDICIGDIYRMDDTLVQVSQPRQPCYKLGHRHNRPDLPLHVQQTGFTGFYFRVLQEGWLGANPQIHLEKQDPLQVSLSYANHIMFGDKADLTGVRKVLAVDALSASWRNALARRLQ